MICFSVPLVPPTVNHYVKHTRAGAHYLTREATAFKDAVALFSGNRAVSGKEFAVTITVYRAHGDRGDIDNYPKCVLDGLKGHVFKSDAMVKRLTVILERDPRDPHTQIEVARL